MAKALQTRRGFHSIDPICLLLSSHVSGRRKRRAPRPGLVCEPCSVGVPPQTRPYFLSKRKFIIAASTWMFMEFSVSSLCATQCQGRQRLPPTFDRHLLQLSCNPATLALRRLARECMQGGVAALRVVAVAAPAPPLQCLLLRMGRPLDQLASTAVVHVWGGLQEP